MCTCNIGEDVHWWVDDLNAPNMYQIARSAEEAEAYLRSWAGKTVRLGHTHLDLRPMAAKILAAKKLRMITICERKIYLFD